MKTIAACALIALVGCSNANVIAPDDAATVDVKAPNEASVDASVDESAICHR